MRNFKAIDASKLIFKKNLLHPVVIAITQIQELKYQVENEKLSQIINDSVFVMSFSIIESMFKNSLIYYLSYCPEKFHKKEINISKQTLSETDDFDFLKRVIGQQLNVSNIMELIDNYFKVLNIKKPPEDLLNRLKNSKTLRNSIIHNRTVVDFKRGAFTNTESENIINCFLDILNFLEHIKNEIELKYKENTRLNVLKYLWQLEFWPEFEIFWYIGQKDDTIDGYKKPSIEGSLSHSETFFLGLWRSQLTNYKVEFLNMSSLDSFSQSYLHLFLRISNDLFMYK